MSDPVGDLKHELLTAAERQHGQAADRAARRRRFRLGVGSAALSIAAAVALLFTAPWSNSPSFLARAEAALTPSTGTVLHMRWELTTTSTEAGCTVTHGPNEIWIDQTPPHRYRALMNDLPPPNLDPLALACFSGTPYESGGAFDSGEALRFVPPNTLSSTPIQLHLRLDAATLLREAISAGRAHDEGKTQLDGRTVERIRIDDPSGPPEYHYVDPETFYPVEIDGPGFIDNMPLHIVFRYLTFEYLPRTAANLALTDIQAQHPNATGP
jgi:hypothetical protein